MNIENEYTSTIDLSEQRNNQFIYAGQLYGTFFSIFATIKIDLKKSTAFKKVIKDIQLAVINYKGLINIGIVKAKYDSDNPYSKYLPNSVKMSITVQALYKNKTSIPVDDIDKMPALEKGSWLIVDRELKKINSNIHVFDEEFNYRDGEFQKLNIPRYDDDIRGYYLSLLEEKRESKEAVSRICIIGQSKIVF